MPVSLSQRLLQLATAGIVIAWPFLVSFGLNHGRISWLLPIVVGVLLVRLLLVRRQRGPMRAVLQAVTLAGIALCAISALLKSHQLLLFYPVAINLVMLCVFGASLASSQPLVERLARLRTPELPPEGIRYTRQVTRVWCLFFIVNGAIALFTALHGDLRLWTLWNGMLAYLCTGLLMAGEWLLRQRLIRRQRPTKRMAE